MCQNGKGIEFREFKYLWNIYYQLKHSEAIAPIKSATKANITIIIALTVLPIYIIVQQ